MSDPIPDHMQALTVRPGEPDSLSMETLSVPKPGPGQALVRVLEVGLDGTDNEVIEGDNGQPPPGRERMVVGHESLGRVVTTGPQTQGLKPGDLVVATVRRPCSPSCQPCASGQPDMCPTGTFIERGILGADGFASEYYTEDTDFLIPVPPSLRQVAILTEPASIALKGMERAWHFQQDFPWRPGNALVTGGSLAILAALLLRARGLEVTMVARSEPDSAKATLIRDMGGRYVQSDKRPLHELLDGERFDFVFEATGVSQLVFQAMRMLAANGILCAAGIPQGGNRLTIDADCIGLEMVMENRIFFGTVNSNRGHFEQTLEALADLEHRMPGLLSRVITGRFELADYRRALDKAEIKHILSLADD